VALADGVEVAQGTPDALELTVGEAFGGNDVPVVVAVDREALPARLPVVTSLPIGERLGAREAVLAEEEQQVELSLDLELALDLLDAQQVAAAGRLQEVVGVDRPGGDAARSYQSNQTVVFRDLGELLPVELSVNGHLRPSP